MRRGDIGRLVFRQQIDRSDTDRLRDLPKRNHGWVPLSHFQPANIGAVDAHLDRYLVLREAGCDAAALHVLCNELTHVHLACVANCEL